MDTFRGVDPLRQETFWKGEGGDRGKRELNSFLRVDFIGWVSWKIRWLVCFRGFFESIFSFEMAKIQDHWNNCKEEIVKSSWIAIG